MASIAVPSLIRPSDLAIVTALTMWAVGFFVLVLTCMWAPSLSAPRREHGRRPRASGVDVDRREGARAGAASALTKEKKV